MNKVPTLAQLLKQAIENRLLDVHTAIIGQIESYDEQNQTGQIQLLFKPESMPLLVDVPILFPRTSEFFISFPLKKGDFVQVIFNEESLDEYLISKDPTIHLSKRFSLQGAIAIPGVYPFSKTLKNAHKNNLVIGNDEGVQIHIEKDMVRIGSDKADEALALASKVKHELEHIKSVFNSHSHLYHKAPSIIKMLGSSDVACKKVFVE